MADLQDSMELKIKFLRLAEEFWQDQGSGRSLALIKGGDFISYHKGG